MKVNFNRIIIPTSRENLLNLFTKFIQCKICMNLLNDPHDCLCCNQTFCKSCIINYIKTNNKCPFSEFFDINNKQPKEISNISDLLNKIKPSSSNFAKITQSLKFFCQNNDKGCNAELNIEEISEHEKICKYKMKKIKVELNNQNKNILNSTIRRKEINLDLNNNNNIYSLYDDKFQSFDSNKDLFQLNKNNEIKHQDSVVSFSGIKNLSENKDINQFYLNENSINNIFTNSKIEKSIEEINQKLSYINNFIINNCDYKSISTNSKSKSNKNNDNSDLNKTENNETEESKVVKRNSMTITNNFYDGSYINTVNNFTNENIEKNNCFNTINNNINNNIDKIEDINSHTITVKTKQKQNKNKEENINKEKDKKSNKICKSLKSRKNTVQFLINSKHKKVTKNKLEKKAEPLQEKKNKEKLEIKEKIILKNQIINNISNATPKLGGKAQNHINDIKPFDLKLNLNFDNINKSTNNINFNNNSVYSKTFDNSNININEDIFNGIKNLNCKMTDIERLLQSNNSFKNQAYSIQNDDLLGDIQNEDSITKISIKSSAKESQSLKKVNNNNINIEQNDSNDNNIISEEKKEKKNISNKTDLNEERKKNEYSKNFEEMIIKIETNIKNIIKEKFDCIKKYIEEQCMEDIKKSVLDTNFDIMTLCTEKLDEFEKVLNEKFNNIKL